MSMEEILGIKTPSKSRIFAIINPTVMMATPQRVKCSLDVFKNWPMGNGAYRIGGNISPLIPTLTDAINNGFDDVMWLLDGYVKELTLNNIFILWKSRFGDVELLTPPADGCIFDGTLRKSVLELSDDI